MNWRRIHFEDKSEWKYRIGKSVAVILSPESKRYNVPLHLIDYANNELHWRILPSLVKAYIHRHLRKLPPVPTTPTESQFKDYVFMLYETS